MKVKGWKILLTWRRRPAAFVRCVSKRTKEGIPFDYGLTERARGGLVFFSLARAKEVAEAIRRRNPNHPFMRYHVVPVE